MCIISLRGIRKTVSTKRLKEFLLAAIKRQPKYTNAHALLQHHHLHEGQSAMSEFEQKVAEACS